MSRFRNLTRITLFALLVLGGVLLGLKLFGNHEVRAAHALPVAASVGPRAPYTPNLQAIPVTNADNEGSGSLRFAIVAANLFSGPDTIVFDPTFFSTPRTITLTSGELSITDSVTITGPGANLLTLSGNKTNRIFKVAGGSLNVAISGLTISDGVTGQLEGGGGIVSQSKLTLTACDIVNNVGVGSGSSGGGVSVLGAVGTFTNCTFRGNTTGGDGGAVYLRNASGMFLGCTFNGNTAGSNRGGAVSLENSSGTFAICTVSGNRANFGAGIALFNTVGEQTLAVTNCTITNNTSVGNNGSGLMVEVAAGLTTTATMRNSIIANNSGTDNVRGLLGGAPSPTTLKSQGYNLTSDNSTTFLNQATDQTNKDPLLGPLQNNGGLTATHALRVGSPALDKGAFVAGLTTDQRGAASPFDIPGITPAASGDNSDIGAVEMQAIFVTNANDSGTGSLRAAITAANANGARLDDILFDNTIFNTPLTINLLSALPDITSSLTINGPGANLLTVRRSDSVADFRIFHIPGGGLTIALSGITISNGNAPGTDINGHGGAILSFSDLTLTDVNASGNTAGRTGGAVRLTDANGSFTNCTFSNNTAGNSGGGISAEINGRRLRIASSTISGNTANGSGAGGGIFYFGDAGTNWLEIINNTIFNNTGNDGGGVRIGAQGATTSTTATLRNSIISNNTPTNFKTATTSGGIATIISQSFNLTNDNSTTFLNQTTDITNANPQLGPLQNNGGPTPTHALLPNSPALDKGNSAGIPLDQRGRLRSFDITTIAAPTGGDQSDIGAVEMQAVVVANADDSGAGSLRQVIANAPTGDYITFSSTLFNIPRTITLTGGEIPINKNLTITGPGANLLTLSGNNTNRVFNVASGGLNVIISGVTISNGRVGGPGGGVFINNSTGTFTDCAFIGNTAVGNEGGAVQLVNAIGTFTGCTFSGNTAGGNRGGAVSLENSSGSFTNCTISGNKATHGAGIALFNPSGNQTLAVTNCTITNNTSVGNNGSGLFVEVAAGLTTTATLRNSIIANNSGTNNVRGLLGGALSPATLKSQGFNLTSDNSTTFLNQATDITNSNPQLGPLQNNGGPTQTHALLANSPALDKGNSAGIPLDQRGRTRPFDISGIAPAAGGDNSDIGAVEAQAVFVTNTGDTGAGSLRAAITAANANGTGLDDILFDNTIFNTPSTINLLSALPGITSSVTIIGPGANLLTVRRPDSVADFRIFGVAGGGLNVSISGLTISGGKASGVGGGILSDSNLTLTACAIINNAASDGGGGVYVGGAVGTFTDCTFSGNTSGTGGGAVRLIGATGAFSSCAFTGNTSANYFSAVSFTNSGGTMTNCTISGNTTTGTGFGSIGIFATSGVRTLAVTSCTIANNTSTSNGGVYVESTGAGTTAAAAIRNTIVANNGINTGGTIAAGSFGGITSQGFNLTSDLTNVSLNHPTDIINANPLLGPLANNGGATQTRALLPGSPAVDKGSSFGVTTDQRGIPRPIDDAGVNNATGGDGADIGAYERTSPVVVSAASFKRGAQAQESIVAMFGEFLANNIAVGTTVPLPTTLDSTSLTVLDAQNQSREAPLFFVSPGQINFLIPAGTAVGDASIFVRRSGITIASTKVPIAAVEPSLFTANAAGTGIPAAVLFRVRNGVVTNEAVTSAAIDMGPEGDVLVLVLYGGGVRKRTGLPAVTMKIGGVTVGADYAGEAPGFIGLDQINTVVLPRSLAGKGLVNLELTVDGKPANVVQLNFK